MKRSLLFVDHAAALGGAEHSLLLLLEALDHRRWAPHVAGTRGPLLQAAVALGVATHPVPLPRLRRSPRFPVDWARDARALARLARELDAAALVANTVRAALYTAPAARLARRPFVWYMRDFWLGEARPDRLWPDRWGKRLLMATATRVITNSAAVAGQLPDGSRKIRIVHNGIDIARFDSALGDDDLRAQHGIPADAPVVGTVGRLRPWKGQDRFLHAAARVADEVADARFLIVGGEPFGVADGYADHLRELARDLGLADRTVFTGQLADVRPALATMAVFVHPGAPEPFGLVNLEAMAMGKPVVAFAHGALPEIVADGQTGRLVPPEDVPALADAVTALLRDPDARARLGAAGRTRVAAHFSIRRVAKEVQGVLSEIVPEEGAR